ncbi:hypothetical protein QM646_00850 [Rhodococcus erythropolis]|nr:hypothetical protein [Rhodococcus erythropolis]
MLFRLESTGTSFAIRLHGVWVALDAVAGLLDIDVLVAAGVKIDANEQRYPVASSRGSSRKYTELTGGEE